MFIHTSFLKEIIDTPEPLEKKERINALSFYYFFKSRYTNSILYDYFYSNSKQGCFARYANELGFDQRTVKKYIELLLKWGLAVKRGNHLQLLALDKAFEYKTKKNGKQDKKYQKKFIKIIIGKRWCMRQVRSFIRVLLFKVVSNNKLFVEFNKKEEPFCKEDLKALFRVTRKLVSRREPPGVNLMCKFGIKLISKVTGVSKSTADRFIEDMVKCRVVFKNRGEYIKIGLVQNLNIPIENLRSHTYGACVSKNKIYVLRKECNSYAI